MSCQKCEDLKVLVLDAKEILKRFQGRIDDAETSCAELMKELRKLQYNHEDVIYTLKEKVAPLISGDAKGEVNALIKRLK